MSNPSPIQAVPVVGKLVDQASAPMSALAILEEIVALGREWVQVHEEETTKRAHIAADRDVRLAEIHARRDLFLTYLDKTFDERSSNFDALFARLDVALANDAASAAAILSSITTLALKSPFADLRDPELVRQKFEDEDAEWHV